MGLLVDSAGAVLRLAIAALLVPSCAKAPVSGAPNTASVRQVSFSLPSDDGNLVTVPLPNVKTVVDAWAPTCKPCRDKLPALYARRSEIETHGGKLVLVAVLSESESTEDARAALTSWGVSAPFLIDRGDVLRREAGVTSLPATLVIDEQQHILWTAPPTATADDVVAAAQASGR
jgi:thiol-disulfide isomerase/thioredoxin